MVATDVSVTVSWARKREETYRLKLLLFVRSCL